MANIIAIAHKELRAYFVSPIAYVLFVFFALLFGFFYISSLNFMLQVSSMGPEMGGPQTVNIN